jgi:hypothetical protein
VKFILHREKQQPASSECTLGLLFIEGLSLVTMERPWIPSTVSRGGTKGVSCVPLGTYRLVRHDSELHPRTWALVNEDLDVVHLPGDSSNQSARTAVLIHVGNWASDLRGCIAPGTRTAIDAQGRYMVQESRKAMKLIQDTVPWVEGHTLEIK